MRNLRIHCVKGCSVQALWVAVWSSVLGNEERNHQKQRDEKRLCMRVCCSIWWHDNHLREQCITFLKAHSPWHVRKELKTRGVSILRSSQQENQVTFWKPFECHDIRTFIPSFIGFSVLTCLWRAFEVHGFIAISVAVVTRVTVLLLLHV